jgi:hypothetical protein
MYYVIHKAANQPITGNQARTKQQQLACNDPAAEAYQFARTVNRTRATAAAFEQ